MTVRLRGEDARVLGQELRELYERAVRLGMQASGDDAAQNYPSMAVLLPFAATHGV